MGIDRGKRQAALRLVPLDSAKHGAWVKKHVQMIFCEDTTGIVAEREGIPYGVVVLDSWAPNSVQCHWYMSSPAVLRSGILGEVYKYVFETAGRKMMLGLTPSTKTEALQLQKAIGFRRIGVIRNGFADGVDYIVTRLNKWDVDTDRVFFRSKRHGR